MSWTKTLKVIAIGFSFSFAFGKPHPEYLSWVGIFLSLIFCFMWVSE